MSDLNIYTLNQLKDSRLLYKKDLPVFGYIILLMFFILLITVLIWSTKTPKVDIIKSSGVIMSNNKNYTMSPYTGEIMNIYIEEGDVVEKGEVLFSIKSTDLELQSQQLSEKIDFYLIQINQMELLKESIKDNSNYFDESKPDDSLYFYQFENYQSQIAQQVVDTSLFKSYGYSDEQILNEIEKGQNKTTEIYYSTLMNIEDSILQYEIELNNLNIQLNAVIHGMQDYEVKANTFGVVHLLNDYKEGMVVQATTVMASLSSEMDNYIVEAYVSGNGRSRINVGDPVDICINGLSQTIYGTISGKVSRIDSDITIDSNGNYFKVDIEPDTFYITSNKGVKVNLANGMEVETRIQYDEFTYFEYIFEALGVLVR